MKDLLEKLVSVESTCDKGELEIAQLLADYFSSHGIDSEIDVWDDNRANITAILKGSGKKKSLLFAGHIDVVPADPASWSSSPFELLEKDGRFFGRGTADMKGGLVAVAKAMVEVAKDGQPKGDIIFSGTAGEETNSCGIFKFVEKYKALASNLAGVVVPEPTDMKLVNAHKGLIWLDVLVKGKTAHGSMPECGENAIIKMVDIIGRLSGDILKGISHPALGNSTISINTIEGGAATNVVPDSCCIGIDIRLLPGQSKEGIMELLARVLKGMEYSTKTTRYVQAFETPVGDAFLSEVSGITKLCPSPVFFTTDAPYLKPLSDSIIILGPGRPDMCHKPNESIDKKQLLQAVEIYKNIMI